jgi:serine protease
MSKFPRLVSSVVAVLLAATSAEHVLAQSIGGVPRHVPGEILIGFASGADRDALINQLEATRQRLRAGGETPAGLNAVRRSGSAMKLKIEFPENIKVRLRSDPKAELALLQEIARQLKASNPNVKYAHPNWLMSINPPPAEIAPDVQANVERLSADLAAVGPSTPDDPLFQNGLHWHYGPPPAGLNVVNAWEIEKGSRDVIVAVLDTGFLFNHEDAVGSPNVLRGYSMVSYNSCTQDIENRKPDGTDPGDACPAKGEKKSSWHGTHVASTIGAIGTNNGRGMSGVAWNVTVVPVRVLGPLGGSSEDISDGIRWAAGIPVDGVTPIEKPAHIINMSLGSPQPCDEDSYADTIDAIKEARAKGTIIVVSAGNGAFIDDKNELCEPGSSTQCKFTQIDMKNARPASCRGVISVAASDKRGFLAPYSNYGAVTITAPGGNVNVSEEFIINGSKKRYPLGVWSAIGGNSPYYPYQGTSMAAPHVSGAIALALSKNPSWRGKPDLVEQKVRASAVAVPQGGCTLAKPCGPGLLDTVKLLTQL